MVALAAAAMWQLAAALPSGAASWLGSRSLYVLGSSLRKQRQVLRNLNQALPDTDPATLRAIARNVWSNLGGVLFEYPHVQRIVDQRVAVTMPDHVAELFANGRPMLVMTAHLANWEVLGAYLGKHCRNGVVGVYSPDDNPGVDRLIQGFRARGGVSYVTKQEALRKLTERHLQGRSIGLLPDVRVDSGAELDLFGRPAMTTLSPARVALRLDYPLVPARVKRLGPARFEIEFGACLHPAPGLTGKPAAIDLMRQYNRLLEGWIRERPGEWLCTKRRWPRER
ncbi:MAG: lysophospholipid acyltransferase family protein [Pseudomonadales bacterium]